jgi:glutamate dehydrogenase (NAD(P)+)
MEMVMSDDLTFDELGPQRVLQYYEPQSGMRAAVVIDTTQFRFSGGGVRMLPDVSLGEVALLARAMTYKFAWLDLNVAGAKAGIWFDAERQDRGAVLRAFGEAAADLLQARAYMCGPDMGTSCEDIEAIRAAAGLPEEADNLAAKRVHGLTMEELVTGYGVMKSARRAAEMLGRSLEGASIALEGLGKVGAGCLRQAREEGARVVGVSTLAGTRFDTNGLDVQNLLALREEAGDESVVRYGDGQFMPKEALYSLPVDILIPGARTHCITADVARAVQASLIVSAGNAPLTPEADAILYERGMTVVPDFVANGGGVLLAVVGAFGGGEQEAFTTVGQRIAANTERALEEAKARGVSPQQAAVAVAQEWLARRAREGQPGNAGRRSPRGESGAAGVE